MAPARRPRCKTEHTGSVRAALTPRRLPPPLQPPASTAACCSIRVPAGKAAWGTPWFACTLVKATEFTGAECRDRRCSWPRGSRLPGERHGHASNCYGSPPGAGGGHSRCRAPCPTATPRIPIPAWQGRASVSPPARRGAGRSQSGVSARLPASTAACSCPPPRRDARPGRIRSPPAKASQRRWVSLQGPISTELIKLECGRGGRKQHEKLQKSRDRAAEPARSTRPHWPRGDAAADAARDEHVSLGGCSAACGAEGQSGSGKPRRISAPSRFCCEANLTAPMAGVQQPRRARLSPAAAFPTASPTAPRCLPPNLVLARGTYRGHALRSGRKHRPARPDPAAPARAPPPPRNSGCQAAAPWLLGGEEK